MVIQNLLVGLFPQQSLPASYALLPQLLLLSFQPPPDGALLFALAIAYSIAFRRNYFWWVGLVLHLTLGPWLRAANLLVGALTCQTAPMTVLYFYAAGRLLLVESRRLQAMYSLVAGALVLLYLHNRLPTKAKELKDLFQAISVAWAVTLLNLLREIYHSIATFYLMELALILPLTCFVAEHLMAARLKDISERQPERLALASHALIYIEAQRQRLTTAVAELGAELSHREECTDSSCFCREQSTSKGSGSFVEDYLLHLYRAFEHRCATDADRMVLHCSLVEYLLERGTLTAAVECDILFRRCYRISNFYGWVAQKQLDRKLKLRIDRQDEGSNGVNELVRSLHCYEHNFEELRSQISELIALKTNYWREICQRSCRVVTVRTLTVEFLEKFNAMHRFYLERLKQTEQDAGLLMGGVLYNMFLLIATNYRNLSDDNIKEIRKQHESSTGQLSLGKQYYCLEVSLRRDSLGLIINHTHNLGQLLPGEDDTPLNLVGTHIDKLIPEPYLPLHQASIASFNSRPHSQLVGGPFSNLFLISPKKRLLPCSMQLELCGNLFNELSVVATFRRQTKDYQHMLLDGEGQHLYSSGSDMLHHRLLEQTDFQQAIRQFISGSYEPMKFQQVYAHNTYYLTFSSPHWRAFERKHERPPVLVEISGESHNRTTDRTFCEDQGGLNNVARLNYFIDAAENSSQTSQMSRPNEVITFLRAFQVGPSIRIFRVLLLLILLIHLLAVALASLQYFVVDLRWIVTDNGAANHFKVLPVLMNVQMQSARIMSKGLSLYAISNNLTTDEHFNRNYHPDDPQPTAYASLARSQIHDYCGQMKKLLTDKLLIYEEGIGAAYGHMKMQQLPVRTNQSQQYFSYCGVLRKFLSDCYDLSTGVNFDSVVSGEVYWQTLFPHLFALLSVVLELNNEEIHKYVLLNSVLLSVNLSVLVLLVLPLYFACRKLVLEENFIYELMAGIDGDLISTELEKLDSFQKSLRVHSSNDRYQLGCYEDQRDNPQEPHQDAECEESNLYQEKAVRKRAGTLDYSGSSPYRIGVFLVLLVYVALAGANFALKQLALDSLSVQQAADHLEMGIRNERLHLLLNLKKQIYRWQPSELVMSLELASWNRQALANRKLNYRIEYSADGDSPNSSPQAINSNFLDLATEIFVTQTDTLLPYLENLQEQSVSLRGLSQSSANESGVQLLLDFSSILHYLNFLVMVVCGGYSLQQLNRMRFRFVSVVRSLSFLNEEMIRSSKRVHSFLQRMARQQQ